VSGDLKNKALDIAQRYCGMTPKDLGVETYAQMQEKMANELMEFGKRFGKRNIIIIDDHNIESMNIGMRAIGERASDLGFANNKIKDYSLFNTPIEQHERGCLITNFSKIKTNELIVKTKKLKSEVDEVKEQGTRGITNNRKSKVRKKAKNGKKRK